MYLMLAEFQPKGYVVNVTDNKPVCAFEDFMFLKH